MESEEDAESLPRLKSCKRAVWRRQGTVQKRPGPEGTSGLTFHGNMEHPIFWYGGIASERHVGFAHPPVILGKAETRLLT